MKHVKMILLALTLALSTTFVGAGVQAVNAETPQNASQSVTDGTVYAYEWIDYVYFDEDEHTYFAVTSEDEEGGYWVLEVMRGVNDPHITEGLTQALQGQLVSIAYTEEDGEPDVMGWQVIDPTVD